MDYMDDLEYTVHHRDCGCGICLWFATFTEGDDMNEEVGQCPRCTHVTCLTCRDLGRTGVIEWRILRELIRELGGPKVFNMVGEIIREEG